MAKLIRETFVKKMQRRLKRIPPEIQEALDGGTVQAKYEILGQNGIEIFIHARLRFEKALAAGGFG